MRFLSPRSLSLVGVASLLVTPSLAVESGYLPSAQRLPVEIRQVISCGKWSEGSSSGHFRFILFDVNGGVGSEVYVQRVRETYERSLGLLQVMETTTFPELNNDHSQYRVSSATCKWKGRQRVIEFVATFEHDESDVEHMITIQLGISRPYQVTDTSRPAPAAKKHGAR